MSNIIQAQATEDAQESSSLDLQGSIKEFDNLDGSINNVSVHEQCEKRDVVFLILSMFGNNVKAPTYPEAFSASTSRLASSCD